MIASCSLAVRTDVAFEAVTFESVEVKIISGATFAFDIAAVAA